MYVAGIDAHSSYLVVAVVSKSGELLERRRVRVAEPKRLLEMLSKYRPLSAVVETSSSWPWLYDCLEPQGISFVLAHARRLRLIAESTYKSDEVDAELIARMHLAGLIPAVHTKSAEQREWCRLIRHRGSLIRKRTAMANQIHGQLHQVGLSIARGKLLTRAGMRWLRDVAWPRLAVEQKRFIRTHLKLIATIRPMLRELDRRIEQVSERIPEARLLRTVPGIGAYRSLLIAAECLPITRFETAAEFVSYCGLAPVTRSTGGKTRHGSLPKGANRWLRGALVRTVVSHFQQAPQSWLSRYYAEQKPRLGWPVARIAAARKLGRALHAMLRNGTTWQNEIERTERGELQRMAAATTAPTL
jgi:transposase